MGHKRVPISVFAAATLLVSACAETQLGVQLAKSASRDNASERDAQPVNSDPTIAPEEFEATGLTIWDGARTLQGVWIAHPLATTARRVRVTNTVGGQTVEGAMFRRDPTLSGPSILVSSDAANGLGLRPGDPTTLRIVALRDPAAIAAPTSTAAVTTNTLPAPQPQQTQPQQTQTQPTFTPTPTTASGSGSDTTLTAVPTAPNVQPVPAPAPIPNTATATATATPEPTLAPATSASPQAVSTAPKPAPRPTNVAATQTSTPSSAAAQGPALPSGTYVQAGAFGVEPNARALVERLRARGLPTQYVRRTVNNALLNIVMIGPLRGDEDVSRAISEAAAAGVAGARKVTL